MHAFLSLALKNIWFIGVLLAFFLYSAAFAEEAQVTARVSVANNVPEVVWISPSFSPVVLWQNKVQLFSIQVRDLESDAITYTITPQYWATSPISGTISSSPQLQNGTAFINFVYLSSSNPSELWVSTITITLNDGVNPVQTEEIDLYIF